MATMYELTGEFSEVLAMAQDPEIDPQAITDTLEAINAEIEVKAENTAIIISELDAEAAKIKAEESRLAERRRALENHAARLKNGLYNAIKTVGKEKFKTTLYTFYIQKSAAKLVIDDENKIPKKYYIPQPPKLDSAKLKEDLKAGAVRKYAHLEQGESLRIK